MEAQDKRIFGVTLSRYKQALDSQNEMCRIWARKMLFEVSQTAAHKSVSDKLFNGRKEWINRSAASFIGYSHKMLIDLNLSHLT